MENTDRRKDGEHDIIRRIKVDLLTFDCIFDLKIFSDWMANLNFYFDWYKFTEESRVRFAWMRLSGSAKIYWISVESTLGVRLP